ncbi:VOC family protein [Dyella tabacisoli]|uniref:Diguanylate cyclase n=1 Tax=Dyella tabacisoli TaxID=2282381 RepID=A0A369UMT3_9GAMM|nr:VOC family protein [Dyella tabacisoli]RDD81643.1 diguanylate cyclase [Dyella tabacisoli]
MTGVRGIDHLNLRAPAELIERLRCFYIDLIGLREGPRPVFRSGSHGYWLYAGDSPVIHLTISGDGDAEPRTTGWLGHYAFACENLTATRARLDAAGVHYQTDIVDAISQVQLFLVDPAGVGVELNFRMAE